MAFKEWLEDLTAHADEGNPIGEPAARDLLKEVNRLSALINTPETEEFLKAVELEAAHQIERWGPEHDNRKAAWDWFWTLGYLGGKAAHSMLVGDIRKAKHHAITTAALCLNWHRHLKDQADG